MPSDFAIGDVFISQPGKSVTDLPPGMKDLLQSSASITDQEELVLFFYYRLTNKYRGQRLLTWLRLDRFLITDLDTLWNIEGFLHCNHMNYIMRTLLVASGKFSSESIRSRWTQIWLLSPHQYLEISLSSGKILNVDMWGRSYGIPFGSYAHGISGGGSLLRALPEIQKAD